MFVTRNVWLKYRAPLDGEGNDLGGSADNTPSTADEDSASDPTGDDVNWGSVNEEFDAEEVEVEGDEVVVEAAPEVVPPTPAAPTPTPAPAAATPPQAPVAAPAPVTPPVASPPPAPTASPDEYSAWRTTRLTQLEQAYALDQEAADAMLTEPETVLPKLAAKVHMEVLENSMRAMQAMVPVMLQQVQYHTEVEGRAKSLFTSINPDLADPRYEPAIMELGAVYRNVNKAAPPEVAAQAIGNLVRAALGIAAPQAQGSFQAAPVQAMQPSVVPFSPARGAGGGNAPIRPSNPFEALAQEMENEDW